MCTLGEVTPPSLWVGNRNADCAGLAQRNHGVTVHEVPAQHIVGSPDGVLILSTFSAPLCTALLGSYGKESSALPRIWQLSLSLDTAILF